VNILALPQSFFAASEIQSREVELPDGSKHVLHFKELPAVEFRKFQLAENSENPDIQASSVARLIAASLVEENGKPAITVKDAERLKGASANALLAAILDINGLGAKQKNA
jgi:hypothetical protein